MELVRMVGGALLQETCILLSIESAGSLGSWSLLRCRRIDAGVY
jgi:hypothetical protein